MKSNQIQACPDLSTAVSTDIGLTGYGYNIDFLSPPRTVAPRADIYGDTITAPVSISRIQAPALTVLMADAGQLYATGVVSSDPWLDMPSKTGSTTAGTYPIFHALHQGFGNVLWVDGHIKAMRPAFDKTAAKYQAAKLGDLDLTAGRPVGQVISDELFNGRGAP